MAKDRDKNPGQLARDWVNDAKKRGAIDADGAAALHARIDREEEALRRQGHGDLTTRGH
ncbi:hypothetical protein [Streptomonospora nanhaiensis]|uniref:hypothetical protein n=1 Tax=Streptomonospora nanhaiensis TaxID=1323731 RepID=UPI001C3942FB|nr:hypothetical protein [Streptomonospora nanhaiensis]MBV2364230.1 hypothetical protein [Streptomonospora nanhaiensis]